MKRRSDGCDASTTRSVKHCARSGCRVRLIHSIIEYQDGSSEMEHPCDRLLRETMNDCRAANCYARSEVGPEPTKQALQATGAGCPRGLTSTPGPTFTTWNTRAPAIRTPNFSPAC